MDKNVSFTEAIGRPIEEKNTIFDELSRINRRIKSLEEYVQILEEHARRGIFGLTNRIKALEDKDDKNV